LQVLFLWDALKQPVDEAIASFFEAQYAEEGNPAPRSDEFLDQLVKGAVENVEAIDRRISHHAEHWRIERMPMVDRNILRLAIYEMMHSDTPAPVVIDEALELARKFSNEQSVQFVNGVLDAVRRELSASGSSLSH